MQFNLHPGADAFIQQQFLGLGAQLVQLANQLTQMDARQSATIENLQITASNQ
jgi:hypothetical protein